VSPLVIGAGCLVAATAAAGMLLVTGRHPDERLAEPVTEHDDPAEATVEEILDRAEPYWRDADEAIEITRPNYRFWRF